jgi:hypothetical protein
MAYATTNPPREISMGPLAGSVGGRIWSYVSADVAATVAGAGYFSNAGQLGMKANDVILVVDTSTPLLTGFLVHSISATSPGAATLGASGITLGN